MCNNSGKQLTGAEFFAALGLSSVPKTPVVSIVGAGGKTTMMFYLAKQAKALGMRVLVTTSTRILLPDEDQYDYLDLSGGIDLLQKKDNVPSITVTGTVCPKGKLAGITTAEELVPLLPLYDLILIEADGSNRKPFKGWKDTEPVINPHTTHTVAILDLQALTIAYARDEYVHRLPLFLELTGLQEGKPISLQAVEKILTGKHGTFQYAHGERIVFCNKLEGETERQWFEGIKQIYGGTLWAGSLQQGAFYGKD